MRSFYSLNLSVAYPWTLGDELIAPSGWVFLIDDIGNYLTDEAGLFLIVPAVNG